MTSLFFCLSNHDKIEEEVVVMKKEKLTTLYTPIHGFIKPLSDSKDEAVAGGLLGRGILIDPIDNVIYSPCDGVIVLVYPTKHAIILKSNDGIVILIHVGMDTAQLKGKGFNVHVKDNQIVKQGDKLLTFDLNYLRKKKCSLLIPFVLPNLQATDFMEVATFGEAEVTDPLLHVMKNEKQLGANDERI